MDLWQTMECDQHVIEFGNVSLETDHQDKCEKYQKKSHSISKISEDRRDSWNEIEICRILTDILDYLWKWVLLRKFWADVLLQGQHRLSSWTGKISVKITVVANVPLPTQGKKRPQRKWKSLVKASHLVKGAQNRPRGHFFFAVAGTFTVMPSQCGAETVPAMYCNCQALSQCCTWAKKCTFLILRFSWAQS